jgi:hypothetical protein
MLCPSRSPISASGAPALTSQAAQVVKAEVADAFAVAGGSVGAANVLDLTAVTGREHPRACRAMLSPKPRAAQDRGLCAAAQRHLSAPAGLGVDAVELNPQLYEIHPDPVESEQCQASPEIDPWICLVSVLER